MTDSWHSGDLKLSRSQANVEGVYPGASLDAHSQIPAPRVPWMTASSMDSQFHCGCLPATITLT